MAENVSEVHYLEIQWGSCTCQDMIPLAIVWGHWSTLMNKSWKDIHKPLFPSFFQCNNADHWSAKTLYKSQIGWPLVRVLLIPKWNAVFLFVYIYLLHIKFKYFWQRQWNLSSLSFVKMGHYGRAVALDCITYHDTGVGYHDHWVGLCIKLARIWQYNVCQGTGVIFQYFAIYCNTVS